MPQDRAQTIGDLLDTADAAAYLGKAPQTLTNMRAKGRGPAYIKIGDWKQAPVRYRLGELRRWRDAQIREFA